MRPTQWASSWRPWRCWARPSAATPVVMAGNERHSTALFVAPVGATSKGRKGTAVAVARQLAAEVDPTFIGTRLLGGFGSGEGLIDALAEPED